MLHSASIVQIMPLEEDRPAASLLFCTYKAKEFTVSSYAMNWKHIGKENPTTFVLMENGKE